MAGIWLLSACGSPEPEAPRERVLSVEIMEVAFGQLESRTSLAGQVHPNQEVRLTSGMAGRAERVHVRAGDAVTAGQPLITLDQKDIRNGIRQAEAALAVAEAALASVTEQQAQALRELERTRVLYEEGAVTLQQLEQAEMGASETGLNNTRAQVNQARVSLEVARSSLQDTVLESPLNGIVTAVTVEPGEIVSGQTPAVTVAALDPVLVKASVSEYLVNRFSTGQEVLVSIPAAFDESLEGTVATVGVSPASGTMTYPMEIEIPNPDGIIRAGMFAEIELTTETRSNVLVIPSEAVVIREGRSVVFLVQDNRAVMRDVVVGLDNGTQAEIRSGLNAGHRIIYRGQDFLDDGSLIDDVNGGERDQ